MSETSRKKVIFVCSPYQGKEENLVVAREICRVITVELPNTIPIAPHLFFPGFLNEYSPAERSLGIESGLEFINRCDEMWVFCFGGITEGMNTEIKYALSIGKVIEYFYRWPLDILDKISIK